MIRTNPSALTQREQSVLDLWDGGLSAEKISARLGMRLYDVKQILSTYVPSDDWEEQARRSSDRLAAAIARHHPEQLRSAA